MPARYRHGWHRRRVHGPIGTRRTPPFPRLVGVHVLIATTGALAPEPVAELAARLTGESGKVTVITVIKVPRTFLDDIASEEWNPLVEGAQWGPPQDHLITRYVSERGKRLTAPMEAALAARGITADVEFLEGEDPAETIVNAAVKAEADFVIMGATRQIFDEDSWESVSMRVIQDGRCPVLVVPTVPREPTEDPSDD